MQLRIAISLFVLLGSVIGSWEGKLYSSQNQGARSLLLRGRVINIETEIPPERDFAIVTVNLSLEFTNTGQKSVILLTELAPLCVGEAITKNQISPNHWPVPTGDSILYWNYHGPSDFGDGRWGDLRSALDQLNPPLDKVHILAPEERWTKETWVILRPYIEPKRFPPPNKPTVFKDLEMLSPIWLHIYCRMWPPNIEVRAGREGLITGQELKKRWRKYGELRLDPIVSEPISIEFPKQYTDLGDGSSSR